MRKSGRVQTLGRDRGERGGGAGAGRRERAMDWDAAGQPWAAGTNALATKFQ
jgi:hypothetical protein